MKRGCQLCEKVKLGGGRDSVILPETRVPHAREERDLWGVGGRNLKRVVGRKRTPVGHQDGRRKNTYGIIEKIFCGK